MDFIVMIEGRIKHTITIDPTVWIFDDRKVDLTTYFDELHDENDHLEDYKKAVSKQWDKEISEGAQVPKRSSTNTIRTKKEALINGTFGIPFAPFLENAEPAADASQVVVETKSGEQFPYSLQEGKNFIIGFSHEGKPLKETGPIHVYEKNGSNKDNPIKHVVKFIVK
ncbi:peptidyl-prolyl cis-trans isomerase [Thalassorhabdus alkalitolerans]|uniref:Peptidyl-prolyl cis-trans isomerase n=1 Tax=Thalassorhabdus alkalitolerans TaxID=2282697 RepID=A0ABW0YP96_9BACI